MILTDDKNLLNGLNQEYMMVGARRLYKNIKILCFYHLYLPPELSLMSLQKFKKLKKNLISSAII